MSTLSLLDENWIPVVHFDGHLSKIQPSQLVDETISDLAYLRPDFQGAAYQFLIGLLQTTLSPEDNSEWRKYWNNGFSSQQLTEAFKQVRTAMQFGATKPSFMQDFALLDGRNKVPISGLLIEAPGENALKRNTDHFIKRDFVKAMCPHCAAMALFTLQTNAPSGGQGHRVSLRGGGPITTLIMPELNKPTPLWKKLWLNVIPLDDEERPQQFDASIFPWLAPTKTSEPPKNLSLFPDQANYCQAFWGMPRRIELDFHQTEQGQCDICGELSKQLITQYQSQNYGIQYQHWLHPLTPYRKDNKKGKQLAIKGQPGGLIYRDWLGMVSANDDTHSARVVTIHLDRNFKDKQHNHLWCFGYDFENMKVRCWYEHTFPVYPDLADPNSDLKEIIAQVLALSKDTFPILSKAMTTINKQSDILEIAFWKETELPFYQFVKQLIEQKDNSSGRQLLLVDWAKTLLDYIIQVYDKAAFGDPNQPFKYLKNNKTNQEVCIQFSAREELFSNFYKLTYFKKIKIANNLACKMENKMSNSFMKKSIILKENHKIIIDDWFSMLQQRQYGFNGGTYNGRQLRANLRHVTDFYEIFSQEGYRILNQALVDQDNAFNDDQIHQQALVYFSWVASFADSNNANAPFASQLSEKVRGGERNFLSRLCFEQLLASQTPEEFCYLLIQAIKIRGKNGVNLFSLADGIFLWVQEWHERQQNLPSNSDPFKRLSVRWAMDYNSTKKTSKE